MSKTFTANLYYNEFNEVEQIVIRTHSAGEFSGGMWNNGNYVFYGSILPENTVEASIVAYREKYPNALIDASEYYDYCDEL